MSARDASPWWMPLAAIAGAGVVRLLGASWRLDRRGLAAREAQLLAGGRCIFAFWHSRLLPLAYIYRGRGVAVLVSRHRDGELIARILGRMGYVTARGSSTRGGGEGGMEMLRFAEEGRMLAITPDGPRGPAESVKAGVVALASRTGFPVLPLGVASDRERVFRSWDRFRLPLPGARIVITQGELLRVPADLDRESAEAWRRRIEEALQSVMDEAVRQAGERA